MARVSEPSRSELDEVSERRVGVTGRLDSVESNFALGVSGTVVASDMLREWNILAIRPMLFEVSPDSPDFDSGWSKDEESSKE